MARFGNLPPDRIDFLRNAADRGGSSRMGSSTAALNFPLLFPPTLLSVTPSTGPSTGGTAVILGGLNFQPGASVTFGGVAATSIVWNGPTSISCTTPAHAAGAVNVTVTNPDLRSSTLTNGYTYLSRQIVVVGSNPNALVSADGVSWSQIGLPSGNWACGAYDGVASYVVARTTGPQLMTSSNGLSWTLSSALTNGGVTLIWNPALRLFVTAGTSGSGNDCSTSPDGAIWTVRAIGNTGGGFRAIAQLADGFMFAATTARSADGINWNSSGVSGLAAVTYRAATSNGTLAVIGGSNVAARAVEPLGTWTSGTPFANAQCNAMSQGGGLFVAADRGDMYSSPDGATWTLRQTLADTIHAVAYSPTLNLFFAAGATHVYSSPDGMTWSLAATGAGNPYSAILVF